MGTSVFPTLPGLEWPVDRTPIFDTIVQQAVSGKETRIALQQYPRWRWELSFSVLRADSVNLEFQSLVGFFNARQGIFDSFLYTDANDYTVSAQNISTGTGALSNFQMIRSFGSFIEPVLAPNVVSAVYLAGVSIPAAGISSPTNGALGSTSSGTLAATKYFVRSTWATNSGETIAAAETSLSVAANRLLTIAAPSGAPVSAIGWYAYVGNTSSGGSGSESRQSGIVNALGVGWTEPSTGLLSGAPYPVSNTTGWRTSSWGAVTPGVLTFQGVVSNGIAITSDFSYYWPCRFDMDSATFGLFMTNFYNMKKLTFESLKN